MSVNPFEMTTPEQAQQAVQEFNNPIQDTQIQQVQEQVEQFIQPPVQEIQQQMPDPFAQAQQQMQQPVSFTPESFITQPTVQVPASQQSVVVPPISQQVQQPQQTQVPVQEVQSQATQVAPVIVTKPPELEEGQSIIAQMTPGTFNTFIKILSLLDERSIITIANSKILQLINNNTTILQTDIETLCGNATTNLHILNPKENIRLFKAVKDNNDVFFIDDSINKRFQVISGDIRIWLPKQIEEIGAEVAAPSFSIDQFIGVGVKISKEERAQITTLMSGSKEITLLLSNNQLKGYLIPEKVEAPFKQFTGEKISEKNADLKLKSVSFLSVPSDTTTDINIAKQNDVYWMISTIYTETTKIILIESLQIAADNELLL